MGRILALIGLLCLALDGCSQKSQPASGRLAVVTEFRRKWRIRWTVPPSIVRDVNEIICLKDLESGSRKYIGSPGHNASPVFSPDGKFIAYFAGMPPMLAVYEIQTAEVRTYDAPGAYRLALEWLPDGRSLVYSTDDDIVIFTLADASKTSFPIRGAEHVSASPDGRFLVYWRREGRHENDSDGWILYRLALSDGTTLSYGERDDGHGIVGQAHWNPESTQLLLMTFEVDQKNRRSNLRYRWFSSDLEELDFPDSDPLVIQQCRYPWKAKYDVDF